MQRPLDLLFLEGVTLWVKEIRQGQRFAADYVFLHLQLRKERWKVADMHLLSELVAQSFLYAKSERRGKAQPSREPAGIILFTMTHLPQGALTEK